MSGWIIYQRLWKSSLSRDLIFFWIFRTFCVFSLESQALSHLPRTLQQLSPIFPNNLPGFSQDSTVLQNLSLNHLPPQKYHPPVSFRISSSNSTHESQLWERPHQTVHHVRIFLDVLFHLWTIQPRRQRWNSADLGWFSRLPKKERSKHQQVVKYVLSCFVGLWVIGIIFCKYM